MKVNLHKLRASQEQPEESEYMKDNPGKIFQKSLGAAEGIFLRMGGYCKYKKLTDDTHWADRPGAIILNMNEKDKAVLKGLKSDDPILWPRDTQVPVHVNTSSFKYHIEWAKAQERNR